MSVPDYALRAEDHRTVLVLVKQIGDKINKKSFYKIFERIKSVQYVTVRESGATRYICFRYETDYPPENNDWGDFQTHRKVRGLISIGISGAEENIEELSKEHSILLEKYNNSMFDSRCFVFNCDSISPTDINDSKFSLDDKAVSPDCTHSPMIDNLKNDVFKDNVEPVPKSHMANEDDINIFNNFYSSSPKSDTPEVNFRDIDESSFSPDFNSLPSFHSTNLNDINHSSDSVESSVSSASCGPSSPITFGDSQASKKFFIPSSSSRSTHCIIYSDTNNCDQLEYDVKEFVNSIFWILESKRLDRSFEKQDKIPLLTAPFEKKNFVGIDTDTKIYKKRCLGRMKKHIGDLALQAGLPLEALSLYVTSIEHLKSGQDWLWLAAAYEGQCSASVILQSEAKGIPLKEQTPDRFKIPVPKIMKTNASQSKSLPPYLDPVEYKNLGKSILNFEEIAEKYQEAIMHYEKYQGAAIVELECSMKAARVFIAFDKKVEAAKVLQNVVFTSVVQTDDQKVVRFNALAQVFTNMGFYRKASFFKRMAAKSCVAHANPNPNWLKCYYLMLESLPGFSLPLDVEEYPSDNSLGWPRIQYQLLYDIGNVSLMLNYQAIAVRHLTYTLHTQLNRMTPGQLRGICRQLEELTAKCEGAPVPLILENGITIPPVNLLNLPRVKSFKLQSLRPHLRPVKITTNEMRTELEQDSIFIFSAIPRDRSAKGSCKIDFKWVEGDICEVALQVFNPLPFELKVTNMSILADDIPFENFPACLSLPAESGPYPVTLHGSPIGSGKLQILGYITHVLGVKNICLLKDIPAIKKPYFTIDVIPRLPVIELSTSLPRASMFSSLEDTSYVVISASSTMMTGQSQECTITISNSGIEPVEWLDISLHSKLRKDLESSFFTWSKENLDTQLPITAGSTASFTLYINSIDDFISDIPLKKEDSETSRSSISSANSTPVKKIVQSKGFSAPFKSKIVEAVIQIQYSGGPGMVAGYCRQCAIALTIEVCPSIMITKWDVLPSEVPTHCYLVLDILNCTSGEMEVLYASNKRIHIEASDICRVPVPVERCPLSAMTESFGPSWASVDICGHLWKYMDDPTDQRKGKLLKACRKHLENLVDLQWTSISFLENKIFRSCSQITGRASISEIPWTDDMLGFILMSPIRWEVLVNGKECKPELESCFLVGDLITFSIKLLNISDVSLLSLNLFVRGYQDHQNGNQSYRIETKRAVSGRDKLHIYEIKPHDEFSHECGFTFFHSGIYKVDILCSHNDPVLLQTPNLLELDTDSIASIRGKKTKTSYPRSWHKDPCLIQKCSPPTIDITILEE
ncbi:trafficking protein particle complex subunit 9 [Trichonephila inaurata madagascariensis]|uniref:Trafficking protein particle complex subunit 9 n=1 Tax=Trichonephila inaurata madagascariensis TaxID=2747483 RepID=A0A8X6M9R5_9ARAC|nr:trafficking protein particle complex subunit 9 [Trichonephila inaurata madagascariensis]